MKATPIPPHIADHLEYRDGELWWAQRNPGRQVNKPVGTGNGRGYLRVRFEGKNYLIHRVIWFLCHGPIPDAMSVDHVDADSTNNRIENLQLLTNKANARKGALQTKRNNNTSGVTGVYWDKEREKWHSQIQVNGKLIFLGRYDTKAEAATARAKAELQYFPNAFKHRQ